LKNKIKFIKLFYKIKKYYIEIFQYKKYAFILKLGDAYSYISKQILVLLAKDKMKYNNI